MSLKSMDSELIRFRIDPAIHDKAAKVCAELGLELNDVLRLLVTRIARDRAIPFDFGAAPPQPSPDQTPFHEYDPRLWRSIRPQIDAEVALALLGRFIADCSTRIDEESGREKPDRPLVARLTEQRDEARRLRLDLVVTDEDAVAAILQKYGPLVCAAAS
jgi:DNA-damage-inducible protein J